jgi:hypothetical protein
MSAKPTSVTIVNAIQAKIQLENHAGSATTSWGSPLRTASTLSSLIVSARRTLLATTGRRYTNGPPPLRPGPSPTKTRLYQEREQEHRDDLRGGLPKRELRLPGICHPRETAYHEARDHREYLEHAGALDWACHEPAASQPRRMATRRKGA